jgi:Tfp pilus assembly protein PilV
MGHGRTIAARWRNRLRGLRSAEAGFALIEVLVSAGLVMVIAAAVLGGVDAPSVLSGRNQASSQGVSLAQQDQERMRAMPIADLINHNKTRTVKVDGRDYSVVSKVTWVTDSGSSVSCATSDTTSGDYLKLKSTVTGPGLKKPATIDSLLAPPNGSVATQKGNLAVLMKNHLGLPAEGMTVQISGPQSGTALTDANGCAFFALLTAGQYTVNISKTGWVDKASSSLMVKTSTVSSGGTSLTQETMAPAGALAIAVQTNAYGVVQASAIRKGVTISNGGLLPSGTKVFTAGVGATSVNAASLYPFTDGYSAWSGDCLNSNPVPGAGPYAAIPTAGGAAVPLTVRQPSLNLTLTINNAPPGNVNGRGFLKSASGSTCGYKFTQIPVTSAGRFADPGFPEDTYDLCLQGNVPSFGGNYHVIRTNVAVTNYATGTTLNMEGTTSNPQTGLCPAAYQ